MNVNGENQENVIYAKSHSHWTITKFEITAILQACTEVQRATIATYAARHALMFQLYFTILVDTIPISLSENWVTLEGKLTSSQIVRRSISASRSMWAALDFASSIASAS